MMNNKIIMFLVMIFASAGLVVGFGVITGDNEETIILGVELPNQMILYLENNYPVVFDTYTVTGETYIRITKTPFNGNARGIVKNVARRLEFQILQGQSGLINTGTGQFNCRTANNGINVSSAVIFNQLQGSYVEIWQPNPQCNNLAGSVAAGP